MLLPILYNFIQIFLLSMERLRVYNILFYIPLHTLIISSFETE